MTPGLAFWILMSIWFAEAYRMPLKYEVAP
jgi:hypothetical protein